ncbi:hypothetical protein F4680DRAFT_444742 [Xylaria scruposa]|nr:hypothetical protein F4680DRAFT_444742 [Xylaria scruposa]
MQYKPSPLKLPPRPSLTVGIYKTLPDASNADLPPKPPITPNTPNSLSPPRFRFPRAALTPSPNKTSHYRKRKYSPTDSIVVPLQHDETAERAAKVRRTTLRGVTVNDHKESNNDVTSNRQLPSSGKTIHWQPPGMTELMRPRIKLQLIHDTLLGGAKTITARDQEFLADQLHKDPACVSALMMWLVAKQVTNKTYNLSYEILHWAHNHNELELMEYILTDRLYAFDMEEAFEQGLMGTQEVVDLMDYQELLSRIREKRLEAQKKLTGPSATSTSFDADHSESDTGSADMDLSGEDC